MPRDQPQRLRDQLRHVGYTGINLTAHAPAGRDSQGAWIFPTADEGQTAVIFDLATVLAGPYPMPGALPGVVAAAGTSRPPPPPLAALVTMRRWWTCSDALATSNAATRRG